jgi:hypothetical protein
VESAYVPDDRRTAGCNVGSGPLLPACFGGGGSEASAPGTTNGTTTSPVPPPTTTAVPTTDSTATETVTGLADVPTTTEVGTDVLPKSAPPWHEELSVCKTQSFSVVYNRDIPAILVKRGDQVIAWAGLYRRDVSDACRDVPRKPPDSGTNESPLPESTSPSSCAATHRGGFGSTRVRSSFTAP